jgi:hypothetical protein
MGRVTVKPFLRCPRYGHGDGDVARHATPAETLALQAQIDGLREIIRRADREAGELREDRDHWRKQAETSTRLLEHNRAATKSWWRRLAG